LLGYLPFKIRKMLGDLHTMTKYLIPVFLLFLCFIMPVQIYVIGDGYGIGIQGAFYRYQVSSYGSSFIPVNQDANYVISGTYGGKTALSVFIWIIADVLLVFATILALIKVQYLEERMFKTICLFMMVSGVLFFISVMLQYGFFLHGAAGISIPFGVPLIIISGWFFYRARSALC